MRSGAAPTTHPKSSDFLKSLKHACARLRPQAVRRRTPRHPRAPDARRLLDCGARAERALLRTRALLVEELEAQNEEAQSRLRQNFRTLTNT